MSLRFLGKNLLTATSCSALCQNDDLATNKRKQYYSTALSRFTLDLWSKPYDNKTRSARAHRLAEYGWPFQYTSRCK